MINMASAYKSGARVQAISSSQDKLSPRLKKRTRSTALIETARWKYKAKSSTVLERVDQLISMFLDTKEKNNKELIIGLVKCLEEEEGIERMKQRNEMGVGEVILRFLENETGFIVQPNGIPQRLNKDVKMVHLNVQIWGETSPMTALGRAYEYGLFGVNKDPSVAVYLYRLAMLDLCPNGTFHLARCNELGIGTGEINLDQAVYFYRVSSKLGSVRGLHRYALMLMKGNNYVEKDVSMGYSTLKDAAAAANEGFPVPFYDLGTVYRTPGTVIPVDPEYSFQIFLKGAELGCRHCQYVVSEDYFKGEVVKKNPALGLEWCMESAKNGQTQAQYKLARILVSYINHMEKRDSLLHGGKHSIDHTSGTFERSCVAVSIDEEFLDSEDSLLASPGRFYKTRGEMKEEAFKMAEMAASKGSPGAAFLFARLLIDNDVADKNELLSLWYLKIAESAGIKEAQRRARLIEERLGCVSLVKPKKRKGIFSITNFIISKFN